MDPYKIFVVHQEVFANTGKVPKRWNGDKTASASNVKRDNLFHNHSLTLVWYLMITTNNPILYDGFCTVRKDTNRHTS